MVMQVVDGVRASGKGEQAEHVRLRGRVGGESLES